MPFIRGLLAMPAYAADTFPTRPARPMAQHSSRKWGRPVVRDNRVGAGGNIGTNAEAQAAADGYTRALPDRNLHNGYTKRRFAVVVSETSNGCRLRQALDHAKGEPANPMSPADSRGTFKTVGRAVYGRFTTPIRDAVPSLDALATLGSRCALLASPQAPINQEKP